MGTKRFLVAILEAKTLHKIILDPQRTSASVASILSSWGPNDQQWFYRYEYRGFYDGHLWGLMRIRVGQKFSYQNRQVWVVFINHLGRARLSQVLGLSSTSPRIDPPVEMGEVEDTPTPFTIARNTIQVCDLLSREDPFADITVIVPDSKTWVQRSEAFGTGKVGDRKWMAHVTKLLANQQDKFAIGLTVHIGVKPYIPPNEFFNEFTEPEYGGW